jgi:hypothetical protein
MAFCICRLLTKQLTAYLIRQLPEGFQKPFPEAMRREANKKLFLLLGDAQAALRPAFPVFFFVQEPKEISVHADLLLQIIGLTAVHDQALVMMG